MRLLLLLVFMVITAAAEDDWEPIVAEPSASFPAYAPSTSERPISAGSFLKIVNRRPTVHAPYFSSKLSSLIHMAPAPEADSCSIHKISMNQELVYQYVEFEKELPDLKEFTLCAWTKFHNHSNDHPLFSYAVGYSPKEISSWVSNTADSSYFSMAVHGQTFYRLNYPLKLNTWYHSCQSWNGKTGEWQIWVNAERVGRGFHNRLVGHVIKGGGVAVSGQEQSLLYSKDGLEPTNKQAGLVGEITMLQLYSVALTAGKAHKDHKHHHAHHFKHDGTPIEAPMVPATDPPVPQPTPIGNGNFLVGGQLQRAPTLNLAGQQQMIPIQLPNGLQFQQQYVNGQLGNRIVSEQLLNSVQQIPAGQTGNIGPRLPLLSVPQVFSPRLADPLPSKATSVLVSGSLLNPAHVQYISDSPSHVVFKRDANKRDKRDNPEKELVEESSTVSGKKDKRGLVALSDGSIVDEALLSPDLSDNSEEEQLFQQDLSNGLAGVVGNLPIQNVQKETVDEREPAEAEVKAVMLICSGCAPEPFKKALVLAWRTVHKKLYSGAHYYKGLPICRAF